MYIAIHKKDKVHATFYWTGANKLMISGEEQDPNDWDIVLINYSIVTDKLQADPKKVDEFMKPKNEAALELLNKTDGLEWHKERDKKLEALQILRDSKSIHIQLFQLKDGDGEDYGLIESTGNLEYLEAEWREYFNNSDDPTVEEFCETVEKDVLAGVKCEQVWVTDINP